MLLQVQRPSENHGFHWQFNKKNVKITGLDTKLNNFHRAVTLTN